MTTYQSDGICPHCGKAVFTYKIDGSQSPSYYNFVDKPRACIDDILLIAKDAIANGSGNASMEIGVRCGGMSALLCTLAEEARKEFYPIFSVDPWGNAPYVDNDGRDWAPECRYGDDNYVQAKTILATKPNSFLFRQDSRSFLEMTLDEYSWFHEGIRYVPIFDFIYQDGLHDDEGVIDDVFLATDYCSDDFVIVIDDSNQCPGALKYIKDKFGYHVREFIHGVNQVEKENLSVSAVVTRKPWTPPEGFKGVEINT
jgi:hypothetical protein